MVIYDGAPPLLSPPDTSVRHPTLNTSCVDATENPDRLVPKVKWTVNPHPMNNIIEEVFTIGIQDKNDTMLVPEKPYAHWVLTSGDTFKQPLWVDFSNPTIRDPQSSPNYSAIVRGMAPPLSKRASLIETNLSSPRKHRLRLHGRRRDLPRKCQRHRIAYSVYVPTLLESPSPLC